jgi:glycosyltransferase involved in cell wall biosynthesis
MAVKISIVIPTYQRPALLKKCLDAIMLQSFPKEAYEVIIVTDGPDEETHKMVQQYTAGEGNSNVSCYSLIVKKGPAAARNVGWKIAKG